MQGKIALEEHFATEDTVVQMELIERGTETWPEIRRRLLDFQDLRLEIMDRHGIELSILSANALAVEGTSDVARAVHISRKANDALAEEIAARPDRFAGFAALPMQDPDAAIDELTRCVVDLSFKGALVNGHIQKDAHDSAVYYDLPEYRPFWARVQDLGVPFYLHPRPTIATRTRAYDEHPWLLNAAWGFAAETSLHALRLMGSGLFDEFPRIQIILGHLGERIPYDMWRLDNCIKRSPAGYPANRTMSEYLRSNFYLTTSGNFQDSTLHCAIAEMGVDRIMFSVDYPFESTEDAATWFDGTELQEQDRVRIGRANAIELFKLNLD